MKKQTIVLPIFLMFLSLISVAQTIDVKWSDKQYYDNKLDGYSKYIIGGNSKYLYAYFAPVRANNIFTGRSSTDKEIKLVAFDKKSMKRAFDISLLGFSHNKVEDKNLAGLEYYKTIIFEDIIYVVWLKDLHDKKKTQEMYVQTFTENLKKVNALKKVYELGSDPKADYLSNIFLLANKNANEQIVIGGELSAKKDQNVKFEYKVLNKDFTYAYSGKFDLPIKKIGYGNTLAGNYRFGDDGNIYIKTNVAIDKAEYKDMKKSGKEVARGRYALLTMLNPSTGKSNVIPIRADNKDIFDFDYIVSKKSIKIFGFYSDLKVQKVKSHVSLFPGGVHVGSDEEDIHGIFNGTIDNNTFEIASIHFTAFTKAQLDNLFADDKRNRKDKHVMASKSKRHSEDISLRSDYEIERTISIDDDNMVLFCSRMHNYVVSNGKNSYPACEKFNVTAFKVASDGKIVWASNLQRYMKYGGWNIYDIDVMYQGNKIYTFYEQKGQSKNEFEYGVFDYETGKNSIENYIVNPPHTPKFERHRLKEEYISVIDNVAYVNSVVSHQKVGPTIAVCAASVICLPAIVAITLPFTKYGTGNIGVISGAK